MRKTINYYRVIWLKYDLPAGLSVFFVALPLCLGIALASGAPIYAGLLSGIIGGLVVSLISGSQLSVSGPAAGLTTVVAASIISLGDYQLFLLSVIIAGFIQVVLGILRLGTIANFFPSSVIKGMLAAIGIMLISKQVPIALGYEQPDFWTSSFLQLFMDMDFFTNVHNFNQHITRGALFISVISIIIMILLHHTKAKKFKVIPAPLIVVIFGIVANLIFSYFSSSFSLKPMQLVDVPLDIIDEISFPDFSRLFSSSEIWKHGVIIAILASLESLLSIEAIDKLDKHNRITPGNRELIAQGIGNMACGVFGAIPLTAVVVRGAANVDAGARTRLSAFTHGLFLLLAVLFVPFLLNKIPYASLAAILLITGYNLTKPKLYKHMWKLGWKQFIPFIATIIFILLSDLLIGVSIGLLISIYYIISNNFKEEFKITEAFDRGFDRYVIKLNTNVTFLNKANLKKTLDKVRHNSVLIIDGKDCNFIDHDILEIISEFHNKAKDRNIMLILEGVDKVNVTAVH
ncbi:MAG: SulP family inorganic anion transporter [Bacteroidales bacterium]